MEDHKEYIRSQITEAVKNRKSRKIALPPSPIKDPKERKHFMSVFLVVCILLVATLTLFGIISKTVNTVAVVDEAEAAPQQQFVKVEDAESFMVTIESRLRKLEEATHLNSTRIWLLSLVNNENAQMLKTVDHKYHRDQPADYITFERDWKISRMPRSIKFEGNESDRARKHVTGSTGKQVVIPFKIVK